VNVPHVPLPLARRIDRLARRAHAFHRFAHHPLCEPYRGEVLRVGRRGRLCKGCTFLAAGLLAGALAGAAGSSVPAGCGWWRGLLAVVLGGLSLRLRLVKVVGRFLPGVGSRGGVVGGPHSAAGVAVGVRRRDSSLPSPRRRAEPVPFLPGETLEPLLGIRAAGSSRARVSSASRPLA
jgi:hypothetical protein